MRALLAAVLLLAAAAPAHAAPRFEPVPGTYTSPIYLTAPPGDTTRAFVVERGGLVKVIDNGTPIATPFINLTGGIGTGGERGLLGMAFPPDYATSGLVYTYLTGPDGALQVREHRRSATDPNQTVPGSRVVWSHAHPAGNHNGGTIQFGPDGMLWIGTGDGGGTARDAPNNAQRLDTELGKLLRIDPRPGPASDFTVPADNPFAAPGDGAVDTIWASGLRNPFRFSFDRETGDLVIGDVGEGSREEIDHVRRVDGLGKGGDFGWRCFEGSIPTPGLTPACTPREPYFPPVFDYPRSAGRTVTGGVVVRDPSLPSLLGRYLYADFFQPEIRSLSLGTPGGDPQPTGLTGAAATSVVAFGEDACGRVYVVSLDGPVNRLAESDSPGCPPAPPSGGQPPPPGSGTAGPDTRSPTVRVQVRGRRSLATRRRLRVVVQTDEAAALTLTGRLRGVARFRSARRQLAAGQRVVVNLRISRKTARNLRRALRRKRVAARLEISAHDAAGNVRSAGRRVVIPRRR
jgi:hypothetical protein